MGVEDNGASNDYDPNGIVELTIAEWPRSGIRRSVLDSDSGDRSLHYADCRYPERLLSALAIMSHRQSGRLASGASESCGRVDAVSVWLMSSGIESTIWQNTETICCGGAT